MSGANYLYCPGCETKALYVGDDDLPDGIEVWHAACRLIRDDAASAAAAHIDADHALLRASWCLVPVLRHQAAESFANKLLTVQVGLVLEHAAAMVLATFTGAGTVLTTCRACCRFWVDSEPARCVCAAGASLYEQWEFRP